MSVKKLSQGRKALKVIFKMVAGRLRRGMKMRCKRKARHGHFWSLASLPLPLPRPLPEKHDMKRDMLVCSEHGGNTKTIGMRGPRRVTRVISISMLDWRPVGPHSPKYVVIPKDTHAGPSNEVLVCFPSNEVEKSQTRLGGSAGGPGTDSAWACGRREARLGSVQKLRACGSYAGAARLRGAAVRVGFLVEGTSLLFGSEARDDCGRRRG
ncbi:hypothetical protein E5676_scaffold796G00180 [Cucumis melo var. makuwa]|uniref:Uncharacterized protein n=1 Tax=Cucumis melo var. makuwa TaxID=1194695 RepID=A0A5D3CAD0_CUCMM|nr:hypothetical protein E5676_scaffold796G00180 [Cucumis melo var. makuwa]